MPGIMHETNWLWRFTSMDFVEVGRLLARIETAMARINSDGTGQDGPRNQLRKCRQHAQQLVKEFECVLHTIELFEAKREAE